MKVYRRFNYIFSTCLLLAILAVAAFNIAVDPLGIWHTPTKKKYNLSKPENMNHVRLYKAVESARIKPEVIFIGSSTVDEGLDPNYYYQLKKQKAFNMALSSASMYEGMRYFQHALYNQPKLKEVIIGLDFFQFNENIIKTNDFNEDILEKRYPVLPVMPDILLTTDAIKMSELTLHENINNPDLTTFYPNGMRSEIFIETARNKILKKGNMSDVFKLNMKSIYNQLYINYKFSDKQFNSLKTIIDTCKKRGINVKLFISPSHATQFETIRAAGLWDEFENWKRELVKIAPVWDFSGYNSITTEPVKNDMKNYWDSKHYRKEIGYLVMRRIYGYKTEDLPKDFGVLITNDNIETHLAKIRAEHNKWIANQPEELKLVEEIKQ